MDSSTSSIGIQEWNDSASGVEGDVGIQEQSDSTSGAEHNVGIHERDGTTADMEASLLTDDSISSDYNREVDRSRSFLMTTADSATDKKVPFHPRPFGWHLRERLQSWSPFHKSDGSARAECASRASQLATSTPDKRRSPPFDEENAPLSPIPRMKSLNGSQENNSHSDERRGVEFFSANESIFSETDVEKNKEVTKRISMSDVFEAYSEDDSHSEYQHFASTCHRRTDSMVDDGLSATLDKSNVIENMSVQEQVSVADTDGDYSDIRKQLFDETNDSHAIEDGSLAGGDGVELRSASEESAEQTNSGENVSGSRSKLSSNKSRTSALAENGTDLPKSPSTFDSDILLPNASHTRRILESLSSEEEDQAEKDPSQTPPEIEPCDSWQKNPPEIEEVSSSDAENDSVVIITDSSDEEPKNKAEPEEVMVIDDSVLAIDVQEEGNKTTETAKAVGESEEEEEKAVASAPCKDSPATDRFKEKLRGLSTEELQQRLQNLNKLKFASNLAQLPDGGKRICSNIRAVKELLMENAAIRREEDGSSKKDQEESKEETMAKELRVVAPQPLNPDEYKRLITNRPPPKLFGGKMTDDRIVVAKTITGDVIAKMHRSISTAPENMETPTPEGLRTELMYHQRCGLTWLLWRETQSPPGGILADDMGLGKTLSLISLIVYRKNERRNSADVMEEWKKKALCDNRLIPSRATLVIAPASLIFQWEAEIDRHVKAGRLTVLIFHGAKQKREDDPRRMARYDVVITTYNLLASELGEKPTILGDSDSDSGDGGVVRPKVAVRRRIAKNPGSILAKIAWDRIVLDEAHQIKNKTSLASKACCRLAAASRWCLTGTPIHNKLWDLFSLVRFLRVTPFDEEAVWKEWIMGQSQTSANRLNTLIKGLLLRRTKDQMCPHSLKPIVDLKPRKYESVELVLSGLEKKVYDLMYTASRQKVRELIRTQEEGERELYGFGRRKKRDEGTSMRNPFLGGARTISADNDFQVMSSVLTLLLRLRQACVHLALTKKAVDMDAFETLGAGEEPSDDGELANKLANMSIMEDDAIAAELVADGHQGNVEYLFEAPFQSAKLVALFERLDEALARGDKCVIVSQWTSLLDIVEYHLKQRDVQYTSITGKIPTKDRQPRVESFNQVGGGSRVLLLSLTAGGVGLNLVGGNHLFLIDLHWNPALEQQACDRIYRMGQTKEVFIHKIICLDTIEERVLTLQQSKMALAKGVLEGAASKKLSKLTIADLKYLFELGRPVANAVAGAPASSRSAFSANEPYKPVMPPRDL
uniref:Transcription termination factor 2 n=1 Tax=Parascaris univalens TaxID=6257 RepID=A0A914ZRW6_PARUN